MPSGGVQDHARRRRSREVSVGHELAADACSARGDPRPRPFLRDAGADEAMEHSRWAMVVILEFGVRHGDHAREHHRHRAVDKPRRPVCE